LLCLPGILGYHLVVNDEEKLLLQHFGEEYQRYKDRTGRFFPKIIKK